MWLNFCFEVLKNSIFSLQSRSLSSFVTLYPKYIHVWNWILFELPSFQSNRYFYSQSIWSWTTVENFIKNFTQLNLTLHLITLPLGALKGFEWRFGGIYCRVRSLGTAGAPKRPWGAGSPGCQDGVRRDRVASPKLQELKRCQRFCRCTALLY